MLEGSGKTKGKFDHDIKVEKGMEEAWDQFFAYIEKQDQCKSRQIQEAKLVKKEIESRYKEAKPSFKVEQLSKTQFRVVDTETDQEYIANVEKDGEVEVTGLPVQLSAFMFNFSDKELAEDTLDVINVLITMYDSGRNGRIVIQHELPSKKEFSNEFDKAM